MKDEPPSGSYTTFKYSEKGDLVEKYNSSIDRDEKYFYNEYGYPTLVKDKNYMYI